MTNPAQPRVIGVLGLGSMGAGVAADLRSSGFKVVSTVVGRSERTRERAIQAGIELVPSLAAVVAAADTFLSIVPADQAEPLGLDVARCLSGKPFHFVECNSITPSKTLRIADRIMAAGGVFSDGGIIGSPPTPGKTTRLFVSGPHTEVLTSLASTLMPVTRLGSSLSQATEMKVLFSAANKGAVALLANVLAGAQSVGFRDAVIAEIDGRLPGLLGCVRNAAPELGSKAARWSIEMDDLAEGLGDMGCDAGYHEAAAESYRRLAANLERSPEATGDPLTKALAAWRRA